MIKDANGKPVLYWIGGSAAICPECGNGNAMLDKMIREDDNLVYYYECRDCGYTISQSGQTSVKLHQDVDNRVFCGYAADGTEVEFGSFDEPWSRTWNYLKDHSTPDTW